MEDFPAAIHLASEESVFHNQGVLFHLVRPTKKGDGVESAAGLANVIPRKRIYRMETVEELEIFKNELLRRPLVLQPTSHSGKGFGNGSAGCPLSAEHVNWVLLINQTHPKILGRIQMGVDAAKKAMEKEEQFLLRFKFGDLLQRLHYEIFDDGLRYDSRKDIVMMYFRYSDWTHGEVTVRYPGPEGQKTVLKSAKDISFSFEDITSAEITVKAALPYAPMRPPNNPVTGDEIRNCLPGWTVNEITPLEEIGETAPTNNYSYAQAGRLYESFRKKKKKRPEVEPKDNHGFENSIEMEDIQPDVTRGAMASPHASMGYPPQNSSVHGASANYIHSQTDYQHDRQLNQDRLHDRQFDQNRQHDRQFNQDRQHDGQFNQDRQFDQNRQYNREGPPQKPERRERRAEMHMTKSKEWYNKPDYRHEARDGYDSNQSSFSTAGSSGPADSGYHGNETDSERYHDNAYNNVKIPHRENLGFHHEESDEDEIMRKHKEFVNKMLHEQQSVNNNMSSSHPKDHGMHSKQHYNHSNIRHDRSPNAYNPEYISEKRANNYENLNGQYGHGSRRPEDFRGRYGNSPSQTYEEQHNSKQFKVGTESMSESFI